MCSANGALLKDIIEGFQAQVSRIVVNELKDNTFYAEITININGSEVAIDSRPSDAIALALRVNAPIFVADKVIDEAKSIDFTEQQTAAAEKEGENMPEGDDWKQWLENLKPEDFGKYEM
mgnify:CR=1 FL=1